MPLGFTDDQLANLPTTAYRFVLVTRLVVVTGVVTLAAFVAMLIMGHDSLAMDVLNSWFIFLGALAGINVAQYGVKRATDKDTKVAVATAKAAGPASVNVTAEDQSKVNVNAPAGKTGTYPIPGATAETKAPNEPNALTDDERGD